jgi:hypothetical protein
VNAQFTITTTPKYNFPPEQASLQLPQHFIELSVRSLKDAQTNSLRGCAVADDAGQKHLDSFSPRSHPVRLEPNDADTPIVAIDVSSIRLGETKNGTLLAVRGAVVWNRALKYRYLRLGPFPFHITEKSRDDISGFLRVDFPQIPSQSHGHLISPNMVHVQTKLATLLERWIQTSIAQDMRNGIILWDGSLTAGTLETPIWALENTLKTARNNKNLILAFSKSTRLLFSGRRLTDVLQCQPPPCLLKAYTHDLRAGPLRLLGDVYVAKLTRGSYSFRLDVDPKISQTQIIDAMQKLLGNDVIRHSYPETLRLAHIFSTFTATEVIGLQRCVAKQGNIRVLPKPNLRRILFGRFGVGPEVS